MAEASRAVLGGFELGTKVEVVRYPDRCMDPRGRVMWQRVCHLALSSNARQARRA
jgi:DNA polymerase I